MAVIELPNTTVAAAGANTLTAPAAEVVRAGQCIKLDANKRAVLSDSSSAASDDIAGIAVNSAQIGQPVTYVPPNNNVTTTGLTAGVAYFLAGGTDEGEICLAADLETPNWYATLVGVALSTTSLHIIGVSTGVAM